MKVKKRLAKKPQIPHLWAFTIKDDSINQESTNLFKIKKRFAERPQNPHLWAFTIKDDSISLDDITKRIIRDYKWFNSVFLVNCKYNLTISGYAPFKWSYSYKLERPEDIDANTKLTDIININKVRLRINDSNKSCDTDQNTDKTPPVSIIIAYLNGKEFKDGTVGIAYDTGSLPYVILLCNSANEETLAHEIGHVLNYSNKNGNKDDPEPFPGKPAHNLNPGNLMYPISGTTITMAQCQKFKESNIILRP